MFSQTIRKTYDELTTEELYKIIDLRLEVFVSEQKLYYVDTDYKDQHSIHYFVMDGELIISYLRLIPKDILYAEQAISRIVTKKTYRGMGLGKRLIKEVMTETKGKPIRISGEAHLKNYYEKLGFVVVSRPYLEDGIPHYEMYFENA